ncbi:hypothetical protein K443DRAFT_132544 [Laccaria amethystina LaAM-08-1]|uniref:Unplaced genomic scaffold K443scaffold_82, whole genome shotgun sequence n=1 Tax=Laccaria amethystina LaAM-08-1 TaxID=1095629 RepID=A0A0C9X741_9AGAR|nr:hypothetical protein K443DRAFT_132544 [Laccaria amethystina LaAM-08-1]
MNAHLPNFTTATSMRRPHVSQTLPIASPVNDRSFIHRWRSGMPENSGKTENFIVKIDQQVIDAVVWGLCQKWDLRNLSVVEKGGTMWVNPENRTIAEWRTAANVPETRYLMKKARSLMLGGSADKEWNTPNIVTRATMLGKITSCGFSASSLGDCDSGAM